MTSPSSNSLECYRYLQDGEFELAGARHCVDKFGDYSASAWLTKIARMTAQIIAVLRTCLTWVVIRYNEYICYCLYDSGMIPDAVSSDADFH